jgi:hypothetical protein
MLELAVTSLFGYGVLYCCTALSVGRFALAGFFKISSNASTLWFNPFYFMYLVKAVPTRLFRFSSPFTSF